jgi:hypothetical protein
MVFFQKKLCAVASKLSKIFQPFSSAARLIGAANVSAFYSLRPNIFFKTF